jgi:hypothetical protein
MIGPSGDLPIIRESGFDHQTTRPPTSSWVAAYLLRAPRCTPWFPAFIVAFDGPMTDHAIQRVALAAHLR